MTNMRGTRHRRATVAIAMVIAMVVVNLIVISIVIGGARDHDLVAPDINDITTDSITWGANGEISLSGSKLQITTTGPPLRDILDGVTAFSVQTYDEDNAALAATLTGAACDPIRRIELDLTLQRNDQSASLRTKLFVRSTMSGGGT